MGKRIHSAIQQHQQAWKNTEDNLSAWWYNYFHGLENQLHNFKPSQEHRWRGRRMKVYNQEMPRWMLTQRVYSKVQSSGYTILKSRNSSVKKMKPNWWEERSSSTGKSRASPSWFSGIGGADAVMWALYRSFVVKREPSKTGSLVFIDYVTAGRSRRMNYEVLRAVLSLMLQNWWDRASQCRGIM